MTFEPRKSTKSRLPFWLSPSGLFLIVGLLVGLLYCIAIPFNAGFDEETHLLRIYELSGLDFIPNTSTSNHAVLAFADFFTLSYQRRYFLSPAFDLFQPDKFLKPLDHTTLGPHTTRSIYPPVSLLPQAFVVGVGWRLFDLPIIPVAIASRIAGLLAYLAGVYIAIRWLPFGKWVMLVLGLAPMALYQAATLNIDGYTILTVFLFTSLTLKLYARRPDEIHWQNSALLILLGFGVSLARPGAFFVLALALLLSFRRFQPRAWFYLVWGGLILAVATALAWNLIVLPTSQFSDATGRSLGHQVALILADPVGFLGFFVRGVYANLSNYWHEWIGVYGHWLGVVPGQIYWLFPMAIVAALFIEKKPVAFDRKARLVTFGVFLLSAGAVAFLMYLLYYTNNDTPVRGVQGRYFLPLGALCFLPLAGLINLPERFARAARFLVLGLGGLTLILYSLGLYATYYTECGYVYYTNATCYQPVYKNLDKTNSPEVEISTSTTLTQSFTDTCGTLDSVEFWVKRLPDLRQGTLTYALLDSQGAVLDEATFQLDKIQTPSYLRLPVGKTIGTAGQSYLIRLSSSDLAPGSGLIAAVSDMRMYPGGFLDVQGARQNADLIFHYICPNPLFKP